MEQYKGITIRRLNSKKFPIYYVFVKINQSKLYK